MSRAKRDFAAVTLIVVTAIVVNILQQRQVKRMAAENVALREEVLRATNLREEDAQLIHRIKSQVDRSEAERLELARLRGLVSRLRQIEQENAQLNTERDQLIKRAQPTAPKTQEAASSENAVDGSGSNSITQPILTAWQQGNTSAAVSQFRDADWSARPFFVAGSTLNLTEEQFRSRFSSFTPDEMESKRQEMMAPLDTLKRVGAAAAQAGRDAAAKEDLVAARKYFTSLLRCGEALDSPESLALLKLVGQGMKRRADAELATLRQ
jgi:hypothetical protein